MPVHLNDYQFMVINGQTRMSGIWDWTQPCSYGRTCQPYWPLMLTDSWALTPRAVHCTERVSMKQEQQCSRRKVLVSLSEISIQLPFPCTSVFFCLHYFWKPSKVEKQFTEGTLTVGTRQWCCWCSDSWHGSSEDVPRTSASDYS